MALLVSIDCGRRPVDATWGPNALSVQGMSNFSRGITRNIVTEYPANDCRFFFDDLKFTGPAKGWPITVSTASWTAAVTDDSLHAATHFVCEIDKKERAQQAADADLNLVSSTFVNRSEFNAQKIEPLPNASEILLVARQAVERFGKNDVKLPFACGIQERRQPIASIYRGAGSGSIFIFGHDIQLILRSIVAAQRYLIVDRTFLLQFRRESGVDRGTFHFWPASVDDIVSA